MPFWTKTRVGPRNHVPVLDGGCRSPNGKGYFSWVVWAIQIRCSRHFATAAAFDAKTIIQSPLTICSRRDHSVCQASANRNPQNSECRRCDTSPGKGGWWEWTVRAKSAIYDCLVLCCRESDSYDSWWDRRRSHSLRWTHGCCHSIYSSCDRDLCCVAVVLGKKKAETEDRIANKVANAASAVSTFWAV